MAAKESKKEGETAIFLATAHPAKFKDVVEECVEQSIEIPSKLLEFMKVERATEKISADYDEFAKLLKRSK